jgi:uncharacterized protein (TIGR02300 family)
MAQEPPFAFDGSAHLCLRDEKGSQARFSAVADPKLGTKRIDPETGRKFYDLNKDPIVSPYTGTAYPRTYFETSSPASSVRDQDEEVEERDDEKEESADTVSLEEADDEAKGGSDDVDLGDDEEDDVDLGDDDDDTFLEDEEEGDDDMSDIVNREEDDES